MNKTLNKTLFLLMILCIVFLCVRCMSAQSCEHIWIDATCYTPKTCSICSASEGSPIDHIAGIAVVKSDAASGKEYSEQRCTICNRLLQYSVSSIQDLSTNSTQDLPTNSTDDNLLAEAEHLVKIGNFVSAIQLLDEAWAETKDRVYFDAAAQYRFDFGFFNTSVLSAGKQNSAMINADGTVSVVGRNNHGELQANDWTDMTAIGIGNDHIVGLKSDGTVVAVGSSASSRCSVSEWKNISAISAGDSHTVALSDSGVVFATGYNEYGQCQTDALMAVSGNKRIVSVAAGYYHTVALLENGTAVAIGDTRFNACNLENWSNLAAIYAGSMYTAGLRTDGTVLVTGQYVDTWNTSEWTNIINLAAGDTFLVGLKSDGTLVSAGITFEEANQTIQRWSRITHISAGYDQIIAMDFDGNIFCAGINNFGQCDLLADTSPSSDKTGMATGKIRFDHYIDYHDEYANVVGINSQGDPSWIYMTDHLGSPNNLPSIKEIGLFGNLFFLQVKETVVALDATTGQPVWQHRDVHGEFTGAYVHSYNFNEIELAGFDHYICVTEDNEILCYGTNLKDNCSLHGSLPPTKAEKNAASVRFDRFIDYDNSHEYANLVGLDSYNRPVWVYFVGPYECMQLSTIEFIGTHENTCYILERGVITALDIKTGKVLWKNNDFGGGSIRSIIDTDGTIYACGGLGPDFFAVDSRGKTLARIETLDEAYCWPFAFEKKSDKIYISFDIGPDFTNYNCFIFAIDLSDYSYEYIGGAVRKLD